MDDIDQSRFDNRHEWLDASAAAERLGVKTATLYTYVSRGLIRRVPGADGRSRYAASDVERVRSRKDARAGHGAVAAGALRWGEPVIDTAVGGVTPEGPIYRGRRALDLLETPFQDVVHLLLDLDGPALVLGGAPVGALDARPLTDHLMEAVLADAGPDRHLLPPIEAAHRILRSLASAVPGLAAAPRPERDAALVLVADHELNASTLAARVAASTGADLHGCVLAALATLSGPRHGGAGERVEVLLDEVAASSATETLRARLRRGDALPGFGHPLYPEGDPRCPPLLAMAARLAPEHPHVRAALDLDAAARAAGHLLPNLDVGLVAIAAALGLPRRCSVGLFAVGRAAGWMAHALEQRAAGYLLRPRARYVGTQPG